MINVYRSILILSFTYTFQLLTFNIKLTVILTHARKTVLLVLVVLSIYVPQCTVCSSCFSWQKPTRDHHWTTCIPVILKNQCDHGTFVCGSFLGLHLPHPVDSKTGKAQWDSATSTLAVTLTMQRDFDFMNFWSPPPAMQVSRRPCRRPGGHVSVTGTDWPGWGCDSHPKVTDGLSVLGLRRTCIWQCVHF